MSLLNDAKGVWDKYVEDPGQGARSIAHNTAKWGGEAYRWADPYDYGHPSKEHDFKPGETASARGSQVSSASEKSAGADSLTAQYKQQNIIGRDIQPIDTNFHVFRPINILAIKTHPDMAAADVIKLSGGKIGQAQAWQLITDVINSGGGNSCQLNMSPSTYYSDLENISPYQGNTLVALSLATGKSSYASTPNTPIGDLAPYQTNLADYMQNRQYKYECRLFNFYADDSKYFSGTFTITGRIGYEFGKRLIWFDQRRRYAWEFYLTGVSHNFRYDANGSGWTTTLTVERGLPFTFAEARRLLTDANTGQLWTRDTSSVDIQGNLHDTVGTPIQGDFQKRFSMMWGHAEPFVGGFFGEQTLASMVSQANSREQAYMTKFTGGGSGTGGGTNTTSSGSADGTGSIKEDTSHVQAWRVGHAPSDVMKYIHSPKSAGLSWGSSSGWEYPGGECADFAPSYFVKLWGIHGGPHPQGNGNQCAEFMKNYLKSGSLSSTPHAGDIASSTNSNVTTSSAGHTWVVEHVLSNGASIVAEENWPGISGDEGGSGPNTWNYGVIPKGLSSTQYYHPTSGHHLSW